MVGLADIPCIGKIVDKVSDYTVAAVFRGLKYMFCYKSLVNQLSSETEKLNIQMDNMSREVKKEKDNGKTIEGYVLKWQDEAEELKKSAEEYSPSCSCIQSLPIPNPVSSFRIGRNAAKKAITVIQLTGTGKDYLTGEIAHLPPAVNIPRSDTAFEEFQSRKDTYQQLYDALANQDSPLVHGIYGMPGVGKTRMMEKFWEDAMKKDIFNKVVRINVGNENIDKIKLQDQIACHLNCHLDSQDVEHRASQLENSLRNGGKILLILDDVWTEIRLGHIIGTTFGDGSNSKGSKILFTSRESVVLKRNKCGHLVEIKTLSPGEALYLFKNTVGPDTINSLQDESLVQKVCDECGHLPLLIHAVGKALKGEPHNSWTDAHDQLRKGKFEKIVGVDPQVYKCIKLSIDNLKDDDAKSCLFLCSLFPEDANIDMKMLVQLSTGSQLIPDGESRILAMVHYLKISSLLLDSGKDNDTKVHDIIRDVARSIAFTDSKYAFLQVTCNSGYLPSNANYCTRKFLRLDAETADVHFDEDLAVCPDLHTLWLRSNTYLPQKFSGGFFRMFANLSFLILENVKISVEQFSLQPLDNLGTLSLLECDISKTDVSPFPKNLKTLWIYDCNLPRPLDVANLKYLRKLEIQHIQGDVVIFPNVISSLSSLEELHIPYGFVNHAHYEEYHSQPIIMEISELNRLKSLHFQFYKDTTFQGTDILFSNIDRYNLFVGITRFTWNKRQWRVPSVRRSIELHGNHWKSWEGLMARAEKVKLQCSDIEWSSICNGHRSAFEDLKELDIRHCDNMGYSLQHGGAGFSQLTILNIEGCSKMKFLFCNNIAKSLVQLQQLHVSYCESMEAIVLNDGTSDGEVINFPNLKTLNILYMPVLRSFYKEKKNIHSPLSLDNSARPLFSGMVAFPSLEKLEITKLQFTSVIWGKDCFNSDTLSSFCKLNHLHVFWCNELEIVIPQAMLHRLNNLEYIEASSCDILRTMFPLSVARELSHLKKLKAESCWEMTEIIEASDGILFAELTDPDLKVPLGLLQLSSIFLDNLPALKSFFHGSNFEFHLPALKEVKVRKCGLSTLFTFSMFKNFQLEHLEVKICELLENIVEDLRGDETCNKIITLSQLTTVDFIDLPNLKSFFHNVNYEFHMPVINEVTILDCGLFNTLFTRSVFKNLNQLEELRVYDCKLLESIFVDARADETPHTSDKIITLNQVSRVCLEGLPKFKSIFYGATYQCYMPALKYVKIVGCGLSVLFTCSVFREIQQLEELHVSNCESLEHIVEEVGGDDTSEINGESIKSSKLSSITLESLPNLKSFSCSSSYVFNMPKLQKFRLIKCPQIEYFSSTKTNTSLVRVTSDWCSEEGFSDLNDCVRQNHVIKGSYSSDRVGELSYSKELGTRLAERIGEENPQETETDQPDRSV